MRTNCSSCTLHYSNCSLEKSGKRCGLSTSCMNQSNLLWTFYKNKVMQAMHVMLDIKRITN